MIKKVLALVLFVFMLGFAMAPIAQAKSVDNCKDSIMFIPTWYRGLADKENNCEIKMPNGKDNDIKKFITILIINIGEIISKLIIMASVLFIIYGGFQFIFSAGEEQKIIGAKTTISNAVVGLFISLISTTIVSTLFGFFGDQKSLRNGSFLPFFIGNLFKWGSIIAVAMIVYSGFSYILAKGDSGKLNKAKQSLLYSILGMIVIAFSWSIVKFILRLDV